MSIGSIVQRIEQKPSKLYMAVRFSLDLLLTFKERLIMSTIIILCFVLIEYIIDFIISVRSNGWIAALCAIYNLFIAIGLIFIIKHFYYLP